MQTRKGLAGDFLDPRLLTADEVADIMGVSARTVLALPIRQVRVGDRLIRFRVPDIYAYLGLDDPNT